MRVLLGAHTIDPAQGGERGIGWNWAEYLARNVSVERVEVVAHPMARKLIEERLAADAVLASKLGFHWVLPPDWLDPWRGDMRGKKAWHRLLMHYHLWQRMAARVALPLASRVDIAHHVTPGSIFLRTFVADLRLPYVIGPVGGGQAPQLRDALGLLARSRDVHGGLEVLRCLLVGPVGQRPSLKRRLGGASTVLCANTQTLFLAKRYQPRSELMIDGGITSMPGAYARAPTEAPVVIWAGKLEARKDPLAALDVAEELRLRIPRSRLVIVGDGWLSDRIRDEIRARSLVDAVQLVGRIPHDQMANVYTSASVFLFTSLRDTFGVQNLEAMTHGLPIVFRDSSGVALGDFAGSAAIAVPNGEKWPFRAAQAVAELLRDGEDWRNRSRVAVSTARNLTWTAKIERAVALYRAAGALRI